MKSHYSIVELLALNLDSLPSSRRGMETYVKNNNWSYIEVKSRGAGGMRKEYQPSAEVYIQIANCAPEIKNLPIAQNEPASNAIVVASNVTPAQLADWQRQCAEARLIIVREIQRRVKAGTKKTKAIETLVAEAAAVLLPENIQAIVSLANAKAGNDRAVSRRSVFEWVTLVETAEKSRQSAIAVLAPKPRMVKIPAWAGVLLKLWGQPQKPNLTSVLEVIPKHLPEGVECPTYSQAYRFLSEKMGNVDVQKGRMGSRSLKNIQPFIRRDTSVLLPTDCYTADGHCFDAEVAHPRHGKPFRPEITSIIDVATRMIVGYSVDLAESGWAVLDAIRMSACEYGTPALFYVDNGSGYANDLMKAEGRGVMARLGCEMTHALPYNSQAKGNIERSHQTLWVNAAKQLPTYIGKDMDDQARQKVFKVTRADIAKFGQSKLLIGWQDFLDFAAEVVRNYNNKPHSGLGKTRDEQTLKRRHFTPTEAWEFGVKQPDAEVFKVENWDADDLFRPYEMRQVRRGEIELFGNRYFSLELEQFHGDMVNVGYDIHDPEHIWVRDSEGRLICKAVWNANKTHYFAKSKLEQARENRAKGRIRRLAVKQAEVMEELSPIQVIDHLESQAIPLNKSTDHAALLAELNALEPQAEIVQFTPRKELSMPKEIMEVVPANKEQADIARWMKLDDEFINNGGIENQVDYDFWRLLQLSKRFKVLQESNEELRRRLETTDYIQRI